MGTTALPLISRSNYSKGASHVLQLLNLVLPGIDINDPVKTYSSLNFIFSVVINVPFFNLTALRRGMDLDEKEEDEMCRLISNEFESWVDLFLDRLFGWYLKQSVFLLYVLGVFRLRICRLNMVQTLMI